MQVHSDHTQETQQRRAAYVGRWVGVRTNTALYCCARLVLTLPRYPRGSHRVIMVTRAVLQLLLHEQWLSGSVLPHTAYDTAQTPITEAAVDALCGEGEMLTKDRGTETILPAMDACQTLSGLLPKFREILDGVRK